MPERSILVLDGHDAAGKTTLARAVAQRLRGTYVKPFADTLGDMIAWSFRNGRFAETDAISRAAIERILDQHSHTELLVFDRHWLSMFTVLPAEYHQRWFPLPPTVVCWTDVATTMVRLSERGDTPDEELHRRYCGSYRELAEKYGLPLIDTTEISIDTAIEEILSSSVVKSLTHTS